MRYDPLLDWSRDPPNPRRAKLLTWGWIFVGAWGLYVLLRATPMIWEAPFREPQEQYNMGLIPIEQIRINFIDHKAQRYPTVGDWLFEGNTLVIRVSKTEDQRYQQLVALHELVEALLCNQRGISQQAVDDFDLAYKGEGEPGEDDDAPYRDEHEYATSIELGTALMMGVNWDDYEKALEAL